MRIIMITPASALRRFPPYRLAGKAYGQSNSITGPLILGGILKKAGHEPLRKRSPCHDACSRNAGNEEDG